jgi:hypothetical protein
MITDADLRRALVAMMNDKKTVIFGGHAAVILAWLAQSEQRPTWWARIRAMRSTSLPARSA